uniref:Intersectin-2 n=1 Tax=Aceria tosichella TaxID=561515 RepID=A0A6G1S2W3_9ACAR
MHRQYDPAYHHHLFVDNEAGTGKSTTNRQQQNNGNELDFLIGELVDSELDYVNDLRLCQNAYINPLSVSFDVGHIFTNWSQLIEMHESALKRIYEESNGDNNTSGHLDYCFVFETFQNLLNSIVDLYVDFCSRQNDAARQLEAKLASDVRFRQLVSESQRKLRKLIENNSSSIQSSSSVVATTGTNEDPDQSVERALRNSNLPLTTFLLKPMQRITKYGLLFDRMLNLVKKEQAKASMHNQLESLKRSAQMLCKQVNEACRLKEDDQDNARRLRWCQSHILQHQGQYAALDGSQARPYSMGNSPLGNLETRIAAEIMRAQSFNESSSFNTSLNGTTPLELIHYDSNTNCLGRRRLIKSGSLMKLRSGRELVAFLFNDFLLLTQVKGGGSVRAEDVFRSERAQQAYFKHYRPPILLEDIQTSNFDNEPLVELHQQSASIIACHSLSAPSVVGKEQEGLIVSFLDRSTGVIYNLVSINSKEKAEWDRLLTECVQKAHEARELSQFQNLLKASRRLNINECFGRLLVTVLELVRIGSSKPSLTNATVNNNNSSNNIAASWERRLSTLNRPDFVQNLSIRLQLRFYKRTQMILDDEEKREIIPISDEFRTKPITICHATRQPTMVNMNESMSNLEIQRDVYQFDNDCTQFLLASAKQSNMGADGSEYLDIELMDDSRFRETRQLGRKRISLDQLLGRKQPPVLPSSPMLISGDESPDSSRRAMSIRSGRGIQPLQPNRPVEMTLKLKTIVDVGQQHQQQSNSARSRYSSASPPTTTPVGARLAAANTENGGELYKYNVKLRLHLQVFCDKNNLI